MLTRWVAAVWGAWLAIQVLMVTLYIRKEWNPNPILPIGLPFLMLVAVLGLVGKASIRLIRDDRRKPALAGLLLGTAPVWFLVGHILLAIRPGFDRLAPPGIPSRVFSPFVRPYLDLGARWYYPVRTQGQWVEMVATANQDAPTQVAAMDRHVESLLARLHWQSTWPIVWYRGSLFGVKNHAIYNMALGSEVGQSRQDADGLNTVDRHEVAHAVIHGDFPIGMDPPALLSEGWAEANEGSSEIDVAQAAWDERKKGQELTLRQLLAPDWYWYHGNSAYSHGGALVNYILRAYGPERFLKLYRNCRQATFEADLQESLGVGLDELDAAYWADVERLVASDGPPAKRWLKGMKLAPGISPAAWDAFLADYFAAAERLVAPYEHVRLSTSYRSPLTKPGSEYKEQLTLLRSGALARVRLRRYNSLASKDVVSEEAILATPEHSLFFFRNHSPEIEPWTSWEGTQVTPSQTYRRALHGAKSMAATNYNFAATHGGAVLLEIEIDNSGRTVSYEVIQLKNSTIDGKKIVTLGLRTRPETSQSDSRILTYVFAADDSFVVRSITGKMLRNGSVWNTRFEYDHRDGRPVLRSAITTTSDPRRILRLAVDECQFGPVPESEFSPESFLSSLGSSVVHRQNIEPPPTGTWLDLYWLAFVFGGLSLAGGAGLSSTGLAVRRAKVVALSA